MRRITKVKVLPGYRLELEVDQIRRRKPLT
jgi:hypothetical protein